MKKSLRDGWRPAGDSHAEPSAASVFIELFEIPSQVQILKTFITFERNGSSRNGEQDRIQQSYSIFIFSTTSNIDLTTSLGGVVLVWQNASVKVTEVA